MERALVQMRYWRQGLAFVVAGLLSLLVVAVPADGASLGTAGQIRRFQELHGLTPDGVVGPDTRRALARAASSEGHARRVEAAPGVASPPPARDSGSPSWLSRTERRVLAIAAFVAGLGVLGLAGVMAVLRLRRRRLARAHVVATGRAERVGIGDFSGLVHAVAEIRGVRCFLVRDLRRPRGIWVAESEVRELEREERLEPMLR
jgi:Putative peptidoglycan binding domain